MIAVALRVSALGRRLVRSDSNPLLNIGAASDSAVSAGMVRNLPRKVAGGVTDERLNQEKTRLADVAATLVIKSEIG